jgi:putative ABC transport system permease protein
VGQVVRLAVAEAGAVALAGGAVGLGVAAAVGAAAFGSATFGTTAPAAALWALAAAAAGALIALATVALPAWRDARAATVASAGAVVGRRRAPAWKRAGLDLWLLGGAGVVFWLTSRAGYSVVLVPEGVPTVSVSYWALAGPLLAWAGLGLMAWRLADVILLRGRTAVGRLVRPVAGSLAGVISASLARQRRLLATASAILGLALAFAISTSVFDATYRQQVRVDALLTNGADVTVGEPAGSGAGAATLQRIAATPGTSHVEPLLHRFAYVGSDLQDLFGVRPATVGSATALQDAYFVGGSARALLARLAGRPDGVLVSAETARDFQLQPGDPVRLRLRDARTGALREVRFNYQGVVKEFPTAPRDSFLVANADYVAAQSGDASIDTFLVSTHASPPRLAARLRQALGVGPTIKDLSASRAAAGSSLTAVDLAGLSRVELGFAAVLAMAAAGLVLALGMAERRRSFAIASALGARRRQVAAFTRSEAGMVSLIGFGCGGVAAWALAVLVVKVLTGVFDPPPSHLAVPWLYLSLVGALTLGAVAAGAELTVHAAGSGTVETLRDL